MMTLTVYHAMAGNPIWWKSGQLYAVTRRHLGPERPYNEDQPDLPPALLTYRDATAIYASASRRAARHVHVRRRAAPGRRASSR